MNTYGHIFPSAYTDSFSPKLLFATLRTLKPSVMVSLRIAFLSRSSRSIHQYHLKLFQRNTPIPLSEILPIIEYLGMQVLRKGLII